MEGEIIKKDDEWFVKFEDYTGWGLTIVYQKELPLHPDNLATIKKYEKVHDKIGDWILSNSNVQFEIVEVENINDGGEKEKNNKLYARVLNL